MQNKNTNIYLIMRLFVDITDQINNQKSQKNMVLHNINPSPGYYVYYVYYVLGVSPENFNAFKIRTECLQSVD